MTVEQRQQTAQTLWEGWRWSKSQPLGNFGGFYARNAFLRSAAYAGGYRDQEKQKIAAKLGITL